MYSQRHLTQGIDPGSQGQYLPEGVDQAWTFLTGEYFKAEHNINAQPGATLKASEFIRAYLFTSLSGDGQDIPSYGNVHGMSYQFFKVRSLISSEGNTSDRTAC